MTQTFSIWSEGYAATGECMGAHFHGTKEAATFQAACDLHFVNDTYYSSATLTYWGCRLFDNEGEARKSFG